MAMKFSGIRHQLITTISLFIALILLLIAAGTYAYFKETSQELIFNQQFSMLSNLAKGLDDNILSAHTALINVAKVALAYGNTEAVAAAKYPGSDKSVADTITPMPTAARMTSTGYSARIAPIFSSALGAIISEIAAAK